jgi:hypothetical protein
VNNPVPAGIEVDVSATLVSVTVVELTARPWLAAGRNKMALVSATSKAERKRIIDASSLAANKGPYAITDNLHVSCYTSARSALGFRGNDRRRFLDSPAFIAFLLPLWINDEHGEKRSGG